LGLFWQITVFLIVAAALGFVIGWVTRGARLQSERNAAAAPRESGVEAALADERDRLRTELRATRDAKAQLEAALAGAQALADTRASRVHELEEAEARSRERIAGLEQELSDAERSAVGQGERARMAVAAAAPPELAGVVPPPVEPSHGTPPPPLASPQGEPDDLKKISGIGPSIERTLHGLGIYHFRQIAQFTPDNVAWIDQRLRFRGRIERENWIDQAKKLAAGAAVDQA
jgi:predicted flap endonuclease-1-like 5' DNA nuclease